MSLNRKPRPMTLSEQRAFSLWGTLLILSISSSGCDGLGDRYRLGELARAQQIEWSDVAPLIELECSSCHADPPLVGAPQSLQTYEQVMPWIERIKVRVLETRDMPPGGLRSAGGDELLRAWISQGAPYAWDDVDEFAGEGVAGEGVAGEGVAGEGVAGESVAGESVAGELAGADMTSSPTWSADVSPLFEIYCNTCHADPPTGGAPYPLKTYEQAAPLLERFTARVLERQDMPPGGIRDVEDLETIRAWIDAGGAE